MIWFLIPVVTLVAGIDVFILHNRLITAHDTTSEIFFAIAAGTLLTAGLTFLAAIAACGLAFVCGALFPSADRVANVEILLPIDQNDPNILIEISENVARHRIAGSGQAFFFKDAKIEETRFIEGDAHRDLPAITRHQWRFANKYANLIGIPSNGPFLVTYHIPPNAIKRIIGAEAKEKD